MHNEFIWAGILSLILLMYLTYTILYPEKF